SLLLCLEPPRRPAVDNHVHRPAQLGTSVLINGTWYYCLTGELNFSGAAPAKWARGPSASSMRKHSFHFAMRSERANEPTFNCPTPQPIARCTIVTSSVSPERAETIAPHPAARAASSAALASVTVPAWFGFTNTALQAPSAAAFFTRAALV